MINIGALQPGDVIIIDPDCGNPPSSKKRQEVIYAVDGNSALTCEGTQLSLCNGDNFGITWTGAAVENPKPGKRAKKILKELGLSE